MKIMLLIFIFVSVLFSKTSEELFNEGIFFFSEKKYDRAEKKFNDAFVNAISLDNKNVQFKALLGLGRIYQGKYSDEARAKKREYYDKALSLQDSISDSIALAVLHYNLGYQQGSARSNAEYMNKPLEIFTCIGDTAGIVTVCYQMSFLYGTIGNIFKDMEYVEKANTYSQYLRNESDIIRNSIRLAYLRMGTNINTQKMLDNLIYSLKLLKNYPNRYYEKSIRSWLGFYYSISGFMHEAKKHDRIVDSLSTLIPYDSVIFWEEEIKKPFGITGNSIKSLMYYYDIVSYVYPVHVDDGESLTDKMTLDFFTKEMAEITRLDTTGYWGISVIDNAYGCCIREIAGSPSTDVFKRGDILVAVDNKKISNKKQFSEIAATYHPGQKVVVTVIRNSKKQSISIVLERYPSNRFAEVYSSIAGQLHSTYFFRLKNNSATFIEGIGSLDSISILFYQKSLGLRENKIDSIKTCSDIGDFYYANGDYQKAYYYYHQCLDWGLSHNPENWWIEDPIIYRAALCKYNLNEFAEAETIISNALNNFNFSDTILVEKKRTLALLYDIYGRIIARTKENNESIVHFVKAVDVLDEVSKSGGFLYRYLSKYLTTYGWSFFANDTTISYYDVYDDLISSLVREKFETKKDAYKTDSLVNHIIKLLEQRKSKEFADMLFSNKVKIEKNIARELLAKEMAYLISIRRIDSLVAKELTSEIADWDKLDSLENEKKLLNDNISILQSEMAQKYPRYSDLIIPCQMTLSYIKEIVLQPNEIVLEYFIYGETAFVCMINKKNIEIVKLEINESGLRNLIGELNVNTLSGGMLKDKLTTLYDVIIKPIEQYLNKNSIIFVVPDGPLHRLSFEMLYDKIRKEYMLQKYTLTYVPSIAVLNTIRDIRLKKKTLPNAELIAFGDPVYSENEQILASNRSAEENVNTEVYRGQFADDGITFQQLPFSRMEVNNITRLFSKENVLTKVFLGQDASESNAKEWLKKYRYIHFATHAYLGGADNYARQPAIVLSLYGNKDIDGFLHMDEVFNMNINADLVVLSACETGLGKEVRGEGIIGLSRAFIYAGTPSVVVSLWKVADRSTALLMTYFYENIIDGMDKAEALRRAKIKLIEKDGFIQPYFWAPFILIGEYK